MQGKLASSQFDFGYTEQFCIPGVTSVFFSSCDSVVADALEFNKANPPLKLASVSHRRSDCELSDICLLTCFYLSSFPQGFQAASSKVHTENGS